MHVPHFKNYKLAFSLFGFILLSGCQVVSVKQQALNVTIANERDSILTRDKLSEASLNVLSMTGQEAKVCALNTEQCLSDIQKTAQVPQEQLYSTGSELYLAQAKALESTSACKSKIKEVSSQNKKHIEKKQLRDQCLNAEIAMLDKSIRYSYAYLFRSNRPPQQRIFDNRQVQIRDFYNQAIAKLISVYALQYPNKNPHGKALPVGKSTYTIDFEHYPELANTPIEDHMSSYNLNFSGLRSINRRDGFGSEFVTILPKEKNAEENKYILDPLHHNFKNGINPNIHQPRYLPTTLTIEPDANTSTEDLLKDAPMRVKVYDPYQYDTIQVGQEKYPLAANFSAPYGLWLAQNNLGKSAYLSLIDRDQNLTMPHLFMLEPY
ncbi:MAG: alpha/beta hydrolase, partial [Acinetobacter sp.]